MQVLQHTSNKNLKSIYEQAYLQQPVLASD